MEKCAQTAENLASLRRSMGTHAVASPILKGSITTVLLFLIDT